MNKQYKMASKLRSITRVIKKSAVILSQKNVWFTWLPREDWAYASNKNYYADLDQ